MASFAQDSLLEFFTIVVKPKETKLFLCPWDLVNLVRSPFNPERDSSISNHERDSSLIQKIYDENDPKTATMMTDNNRGTILEMAHTTVRHK